MIRLLLVALTLLAAPSAALEETLFAKQPRVTWERDVGGPGGDRVAALARLGDGSFAAAGARFAGGEDEGNAWIALYAYDGALRWQQTIGGTGDQAFTAIAATGAAIVALGTDDATLRPLAAAYDADGRALWRTTDALDGDVALLGAAAAGPSAVLTGAARQDGRPRGVVLALDPATGDVRWRYDDEAAPPSVFLAAGPEGGGLLVTGWTEAAGDIPRKRPVLLRLDTDGAVLWRRMLGAEGEEGAFHALSPRPGGGAVLSGTAILGTGHPVPRVMAVDGDGNFVWEYRPEDALGSALAVAALPGGGAVAAGYSLDRSGPVRRAWLAGIDAEGELLWRKAFAHEGDAAIHALALSGTALVAAGSRVAGDQGEDGWIFQLR